jgi:preprotein translocase subunit SecG
MDATYNFSLGFAQGRESEIGTPNRLIIQKAIQMISTGISLISLFLGFSIFGILIIVNQHQAELTDLSGGSSYAAFGGVGAILVGTTFFVAACFHWRSCALTVWKSACAGEKNRRTG